MTQTERITRMEKLLDEGAAAVAALSDALERYEAARDGLRTLARYYDGGAWRRDFEDDEAGRLPKELKRGVLSEDAVHDLLSEDHAIAVRMADLLANILRDGRL